MTFLKLSNIIINTSKITTIRKYNNIYRINILHFDISGFILAGSGHVGSSSYNIIEVCKVKQPEDHNIITEWIDKLK